MTEKAGQSFGREGAEPALAGDLCKSSDTAHDAFFHVAVNPYEFSVAASSLRARSRTKCW